MQHIVYTSHYLLDGKYIAWMIIYIRYILHGCVFCVCRVNYTSAWVDNIISKPTSTYLPDNSAQFREILRQFSMKMLHFFQHTKTLRISTYLDEAITNILVLIFNFCFCRGYDKKHDWKNCPARTI